MRAGGVIIAVEDRFICRLLEVLLAPYGYAVVAAAPSRAVEVLRAADRPPILATNAPDKFLEFADKVPLLYLAAAPDDSLAERFCLCRVLRKPFHTKKLLAALVELSKTPGSSAASTQTQ